MTAPNECLVLLFHSVDDRDILSLRDLGNIRPEAFDKTVAGLKEEFDILGLEDLVRCISGQATGPERPLAITFDDGAKSYVTNAVPIMESHGLPSTCFLITDCVDDRAIYWRYLYNYCVNSGRIKELEAMVAEEYGVPALQGRIIHFTRNNFSKEATRRIMERISENIVSEDEYREREGRLFMSFEDVESLKKNPLVTFGIHTCSHPVMKGLTDQEIKGEISGSLDFYRTRVGDDVPMFSVPFGRLYRDYDERTVNIALGLSIEHVFSAYGGGNAKGQALYNVRRIPVQEDRLKEGVSSSIAHIRDRCVADDYMEEEARLLSAVEGLASPQETKP
ncbi:MAG: polysaccharide deacetylase family protein [Candidatus Sulfobium sp.]